MEKSHQSIILSYFQDISHVSGVLVCSVDVLIYPFVLCAADTRHVITFVKYAIDMGSGAMIYTPNLMKISSGFQNSLYRHTKSKVIS
jgi:uncharacterized Fe-S cluster-containing radical SAM superfamily enzyme